MSFAEGISYFVYWHFSVVVFFSPTFCVCICTDKCDAVHVLVTECRIIIDTPDVNKGWQKNSL